MLEILVELLVCGMGEVIAGAFARDTTVVSPASPPPPPPGPELGESVTIVEDGRIRRWSRRREKRGDIVRLIEYRSDRGTLAVCRIVADDKRIEGAGLNAAVRPVIERLRALHEGELRVESNGEVLIVRASGEPRGRDRGGFERECSTLRRVLGRAVSGLAAETVVCPVCREPAPGAPACATCAAPHHAGCWTYVGRCSIYGCRGARLVS